MADIFAKENIQIDDINAPSPVNAAVDALGQPTARPSGAPDAGVGADKLQAPSPNVGATMPGSALPADTTTPDNLDGPVPSGNIVPFPQPPSYYQNAGYEPAAPGSSAVDAPPAPPQVALPLSGPRDIFATENISAPTIPQQNQDAMNGGASLVTPQTPQDHAAVKYVDEQTAQTMQLAASRFTPQQIQDMKAKGPITFSEVGHYLSANDVIPGGGIYNAVDALELTAAAQKLKTGASYKDLSVEEQSVIDKYINRQLEENIRGFSIGGKIAYSGAQIPAFVTEFVATGGVGKIAQEVIVKGGEDLALHAVVNAVAGGAAKTLAQTSLMLPQYSARYGEMRVNDGMALTDKGALVAKESAESPAISALKAFGYTAADVAGQVAAPGIGKFITDPLTKAVSTPLISAVNNVPAPLREALYQAYLKIQPTAQVSKVFTSAGWNGMLEQLGANRVSQILHATTNLATTKNYTMDDYLKEITPDKDQLMVEGGLIALAHGIHTATSVATNLMISRGVPENRASDLVDSMTANEKEQFVQQNLQTPKSAYPAFPVDIISEAEADKQMGRVATAHEPMRVTVHPDYINSTPEGQVSADVRGELRAQRLGQIHADTTGSEPVDVIRGQIDSLQAHDAPPIQNSQSGFNAGWQKFKQVWKDQIYPELFNDIQPIEDLATKARDAGADVKPGEDTGLLARHARQLSEQIRYNLQVATMHYDENGNLVQTGKAPKSVYDDFDNMFLTTEPSLKQRHVDFDNYQKAQSFIEDSEKGLSEVSDKMLAKSAGDLVQLSEKYGDNFRFFETYAQELRDADNRVLFNLVQSGLKSQEWYDEIVNKREKYAPMSRILEKEPEFSPAITARGIGQDPNANRVGALKQRVGSDLEVRNLMENRIKNWAQIIQKSAVNDLRVKTAKYAQFYPEDVKVSNPRLIEKEVTASYDPKLRAKLEATIKLFGDDIERTPESKANGKNVLGSYSASEKLVRMKIGSTEGTLAHEVGHMLDYKLGLKEKMLGDDAIKKELQKLAEDRLYGKIDLTRDAEDELHFKETLTGQEGTEKYRKYIKSDPEILANFFDAYVNSPDQLKAVAPKALKAFDKLIDSNKDLTFLKDIKPSTSRAEEVIRKPIRDLDGPEGSLPFYENGKRKFLEVSEPLQKAFKGVEPTKIGMLEKIIGAPFRASTRLLRFGATSTPEFILRHAIRGVQTSFLNTEGKATPLGFAKGIFDVLGRSQDYKDWAAASGKFDTFMPLDDKSLAKAYAKMFKKPSTLDWFNPLRYIDKLKEVGDQSPRVASFKAYKKSGMSDLEAGIASLDATGDFGRHGTLSKKINQYAPFFNDMLQGGDRGVRGFKKDPKGYTARAIAIITLPQVALTGYYLYAADNKTRQEYLELPMWRRQLFMNIKIGDYWIPIPRAFAPGYIFGAMPEQIMIHEYGGYHPEPKNAWFEMMKGAASSVSPIFDWSKALNPLFKSFIEDSTNYSFFAEHPIYSPEMSKLPASQRSNTYTSESAKALGKLFNFSPAMIDETVQVMGGNLGKYAMELGDKGIATIKGMEGQKVSEKPSDLSNVPFVRGFIERDPTGNTSESAQEFYSHFDTVAQKHAQMGELEGKEQSKYVKDNRLDLDQYENLNQAKKEISQLTKQSKEVYANVNMSGDQKQRQIEKNNNQITEIARKANIQYIKATGEKR